MRRALFLVILVLWASVGYAYVQPEIVYLEARLSPAQEKIVHRGIAHMTSFYNRIGDPVPVDKISLRLFASPKEYKSYRDRNSSSTSPTGYHSPKKSEIVVPRTGKFMNTILHESNHVLFRAHFPKGTIRTIWLNEGLSEYFEYMQIGPGQSVTVNVQPQKLKRIRKWVNGNMGDRIEQVISMTKKDWKEQYDDPDHESYTVSWAAIYFLMSKKDREHIIGGILNAMMEKKSSKQAVDAAYPGGFNKFVSDFVSFYRK
jgi:hypothetical protein